MKSGLIPSYAGTQNEKLDISDGPIASMGTGFKLLLLLLSPFDATKKSSNEVDLKKQYAGKSLQ